MKRLSKIMYSSRQFLLRQSCLCFLKDSQYAFELLIGKFRGFLAQLTGKVVIEGGNRSLIIGPGVKYNFQAGSAIVLKDTDDIDQIDPRYQQLCKGNSLIGVRNTWRLLNHPEYRGTRIRLMQNAQLVLEPNTKATIGTVFSVWPNKKLEIGAGTSISHGVMINTRCGMRIGRNCLIAREAMLMDYDGHPIFNSVTPSKEEYSERYGGKAEPITIEDNVWIGFRASIMKGVTIGAGSIVSANSCVYQDVPPNCIVAGNPARVIKEGISWAIY